MPTTRKQPLSGKITQEEKKYQLKELELNALLEVTEAINSNIPEEALYRIFHFTLIANLNIKKLALFVLDSEWECKVCFGTELSFKNRSLPKTILKLNKITELKGRIAAFKEFDIILPIAHKEKPLAFVFIGGVAKNKGLTDLPFIQTLASIIIVAIENKKLARKELQQEAFRKELQIARDVQTHLFPKTLPGNEYFRIHASYLPNLVVGGDYYDYLALDDDRFLICIADVSGKGIPAALLMSNFQASLRTLVRQTTDLKQIIKEINIITKGNSRGERFITFFAGIYSKSSHTLTYVNAGHNPPFLISEAGEAQALEKGTTVLGIFDELPFVEEGTIPVSAKSLLFCYTDGLPETNNPKDEEFGLERLKDFLSKKKEEDLPSLHEEILKVLHKFKAERVFPDDITFISCYFCK